MARFMHNAGAMPAGPTSHRKSRISVLTIANEYAPRTGDGADVVPICGRKIAYCQRHGERRCPACRQPRKIGRLVFLTTIGHGRPRIHTLDRSCQRGCWPGRAVSRGWAQEGARISRPERLHGRGAWHGTRAGRQRPRRPLVCTRHVRWPAGNSGQRRWSHITPCREATGHAPRAGTKGWTAR